MPLEPMEVTLVWSCQSMLCFEWFADVLQEAADSFPPEGGKSALRIRLVLHCTREQVPTQQAQASVSANSRTFRDDVNAGRPNMSEILAAIEPTSNAANNVN